MKALHTLVISAFLGTYASAATPSITPAQAFERIKQLAGEWRGPAAMKGMPPSHSIFRITAGGSAVEETIFPGEKMEMLSIYHLDKGDLLMTHYCAIGNQPRTKFNPKKSTSEVLVFDFDGGTNLNPRKDMHMHNLRLTLPKNEKAKPQKITVAGESWNGGKPAGACGEVVLTRRK